MLEGPTSAGNDGTWITLARGTRNAHDRLVELRVGLFIKVHDGLARESYLAGASATREGQLVRGHLPSSMTPAIVGPRPKARALEFRFRNPSRLLIP